MIQHRTRKSGAAPDWVDVKLIHLTPAGDVEARDFVIAHTDMAFVQVIAQPIAKAVNSAQCSQGIWHNSCMRLVPAAVPDICKGANVIGGRLPKGDQIARPSNAAAIRAQV